MSVDYASAKSALKTWVQNVCDGMLAAGASDGLPIVFFSEEDHEYAIEPFAEIEIGDEASRGRDQTKWEYQSGTDTVSPRVSGLREAVVRVTIRTRSASAGNSARNAMSALHSSLMNPLHMEQLRDDGNVSFVRVELFTTQLIESDGRRENVAIMDVRFGLSAVQFDAASGAPWVRNAGLTNQIKRTDGTAVEPGASEEPVGVDYPPPGS